MDQEKKKLKLKLDKAFICKLWYIIWVIHCTISRLFAHTLPIALSVTGCCLLVGHLRYHYAEYNQTVNVIFFIFFTCFQHTTNERPHILLCIFFQIYWTFLFNYRNVKRCIGWYHGVFILSKTFVCHTFTPNPRYTLHFVLNNVKITFSVFSDH